MKLHEQIAKIADTYGYEAQSRQCVEECAELIQAISKLRRFLDKGDDYGSIMSFNNLTEEVADVQIMLWQMTYLLDVDITETVKKKIDRQLKRIEEGL